MRLVGDDANGGLETFSTPTVDITSNDTDEEVDGGNTDQSITIIGINGTMSLTGTSAMGAAVSVNADGSFTYDPQQPNSAVQALAEGQTANDSFTYTISDNADQCQNGHGDSKHPRDGR